MRITPFAYQICWILLGPFIRLYLHVRIIQKKEYKSRIKERFGHGYKSSRPEGTLIWLHAVSLGESNAAINLVTHLKDKRSEWHFLITTNTITAADHIVKNCGAMPVTHVFQPLDHPQWVSRFLDYWKPNGAIFLESDFWFNMVTITRKRQRAVIFASSQISYIAKTRWKKNPSLARKLFSSPTLILAIDDKQKNHFEQLAGCVKDNISQKVKVIGSLKTRVSNNTLSSAYEKALKLYAKQAGYKLILAASTHEKEEQLIAKAVAKLDNASEYLLIFAPRHPNRALEIMDQIGKMPQRSKGELPLRQNPYFLSDSFGEMTSLYNVADIIIIGGSFFHSGGHNPIEPSLAGKPIICGKSIFNNEADYLELMKAGIIRQVKSNETLAETIDEILHSDKVMMRAIIKGQEIAHEACMRPAKAAHCIISTIEK